MNKKVLSERDTCTKFITPAVARAGWDVQTQVREEVDFTKGRVIVRGKMITRGKPRRADYHRMTGNSAYLLTVIGMYLTERMNEC